MAVRCLESVCSFPEGIRNDKGQEAKRLYVSGGGKFSAIYTLLDRAVSYGYPRPSHRKAGNLRFLDSVENVDKMEGAVTRVK